MSATTNTDRIALPSPSVVDVAEAPTATSPARVGRGLRVGIGVVAVAAAVTAAVVVGSGEEGLTQGQQADAARLTAQAQAWEARARSGSPPGQVAQPSAVAVATDELAGLRALARTSPSVAPALEEQIATLQLVITGDLPAETVLTEGDMAGSTAQAELFARRGDL